MIVRRAVLAVSVAALALLATSCGRYEVPVVGGHGGESPAGTVPPETVEAPAEQVLVVTVRDVPELAAYAVVDGECVPAVLGPDSPQLVVADHAAPDEEGEGFDLPGEAALLEDGSCEATFEVTVAGADAYDLGVVVPGRGIADPADPEDEPVEVTTSPQEVTVLR